MKKDFYSFEQWCKDNGHEDLLDLWDYELNDKKLSEVSFKSSKQFWFKCPRGIHESSRKTMSNLTINKHRYILCDKCNSLGQWMIDNLGNNSIETFWSDKNNISPFEVSHSSMKKVWIKCSNVNHPDYLVIVRNFTKGSRCPVCLNRKVIAGINDIWTTHPEHAKYFLNADDAKRYSFGSSEKVYVICPDCGYIMLVDINSFCKRPFSCPRCGDQVSYPNKFIHEFLIQLKDLGKVDFQPEMTFNWSKNINGTKSKRTYDFYLNYPNNFIIEANGRQHFDRSFDSIAGARSLKEEQENDIFKYNLAIQNGISSENYIVIDCKYSNKEWIKSQILNSELPQLLSFEERDINWDMCNKFACSSYVVLASKLWSDGIRSTSAIAQKMNMNSFTIENYLHRGAELGLCDYDAELVKKFQSIKPILCLEKNIAFVSAQTCSDMSYEIFGCYFNKYQIQYYVRENKQCCGFNLSYISQFDYYRFKSIYPNNAFGDIYVTGCANIDDLKNINSYI